MYRHAIADGDCGARSDALAASLAGFSQAAVGISRTIIRRRGQS